MHPRAAEFRERVAEEYGLGIEIEEFSEGTKTAAAAAAAVGCDVAQIASSLVSQIASSLVFEADGEPVMVVTSGANRVDEDRVAEAMGADSVGMADADRIKELLGWSIGGVPPICHDSDVPVLFDPILGQFDTVWAGAGTSEACLADAEEHPVTTAPS
ncbi:YbaK/EbsC family protein [Natrialba aegyptia]|uniref:YbaK/aminoacyl-tRNA synthetase-associated domain-containing protein n=1 Tax=Natrialba aegyptia DSM 13077 TaxID=1227491 RepID=M0AVZ1_9EURY|nr:YbaK/EbsC family protein [Natrialba aegyptia]ELZ02128.1 hypothetical protein C480_17387 [Natrialba aegyptia DSM 13077]